MKPSLQNPPRLGTWLIEQLGDEKHSSALLGDLHELFISRVNDSGLAKARLLYWYDFITVLAHAAIKRKKSSSRNHMTLFNNYFKVACRNLVKQKAHTLINVFGLSIGFAFSLLIFVYVTHELSYDRFHANADRTYLLPMTWHFNGTDLPTGANCSIGGPFMKESFPEVDEFVRFSISSLSLRKGNEVFKEQNVLYADSSFFKIFSFTLLQGDPAKALTAPNSIVLTRSTAEKYFGMNWMNENITSKTLPGAGHRVYQITGVTDDVPQNSHIRYNCLVSFSTLAVSRVTDKFWDNSQYYTYLLLNPKADIQKIKSEIPSRLNAAFGEKTNETIGLDLVPLKDIYLNNKTYNVPNTSNIIYVKIFSVIAILILVIATVNYINLATARSMERALEVGVRKVMGALRGQLFYQFLSESVVVTIVSIVLSLLLAKVFLPLFNIVTERKLVLTQLLSMGNIAILLFTAIVISLLAGIYPAVFMSGYKPARVLKGKLRDSVQGSRLRKGLVVVQFFISIALITCTLMISSQVKFFREMTLGYDKEHLVSLSMDSMSLVNRVALKTSLQSRPGVAGVSSALQTPTNFSHQTSVWLKGQEENEKVLIRAAAVDSDFIHTTGLHIIEGTNFTPGVELNSDQWEIILNESAVNFFGWSPSDAIGKEITVWQTKGIVKGVVKDFHSSSLHNPIAPLIIFSGKGILAFNNTLVNMSGSPEEIRNTLESVWKQINPDSPFVLTFLEDQYENLYSKESQLGIVVNTFAALAIIISILGLFGLASYSVVQRTKEFGIRKVLGATVTNLFALVSRSFVGLIAVAFLLAAPFSWYIMQQWLEGFAYHLSFNWWLAIGAGALTLLLALVTIGYHSLEIAKVNPSSTLRNQ